MKRLVGILFVLVLVACIATASASVVSTSYNKYVELSVEQPDEAKANTINTVLITITPKTTYPIDVRAVVVPSHFVIKPEWVSGVDAMKTGTGVTFTARHLTDEKTIRIAIPGNVLEGYKGDKVELIKEVRFVAYPSAGTSGEVHAYELSTLNVDPTSFITYESPWEAAFPVLMMIFGVVLVIVAKREL